MALVLGTLLCGCSDSTTNDGVAQAIAQAAAAPTVAKQASRSGTVQLDASDSLLFVVNAGTVQSTGSLSVIQVKDGSKDVGNKLGEVTVGNHPESVSVLPNRTRAYVSNAADNTVSVIDLLKMQVIATIAVGSEPRGTALTPSGRKLYVANFSDGTISVIDTTTNQVTSTINLGGDPSQLTVNAPFALLVTNKGDGTDANETLLVTDFWARPRQGKTVDQIEGFDDGKEGRLARINVSNDQVVGFTPILPMDTGFTQDRSAFAATAVPAPFKNTYSPAAGVNVTAVPSNAFFNQLSSLSVDPDNKNRVYLTSIAAQPEPPVRFNNNVQSLVGAVDATTGNELTALKTNLNNLIKVETQPAVPFNGSLTRAFMADTVDMVIRKGTALFVSRAGSYVLRGQVNADGSITLNNSAATAAVRIPTGNIPNGITADAGATRAYVNNGVDRTITTIDLGTNASLNTIASADLPAPGTLAHNAIIGELVFFTGMGASPNGLVGGNVRNIKTHQFRGLASDNNWSSCASCHYLGLNDNVTWSFGTGPRNTISMDGSFSKANASKQRVFNLSAVMGSVTDFNNNSRGVQGGIGFTPNGNADAAQVFAHGPSSGVSEALDLMTLWFQVGIRTLNAPSNLNAAQVSAGRAAFAALNCTTCHGGDLWTSSQVRWNRPLFASGVAPLVPLDRRVQNLAAGAVLTNFDPTGAGNFTGNPAVIPIITRFTDPVTLNLTSPTLDLTNPIEIRGAGAAGVLATAPVGAAGSFNPPSLLGLHASGPYGHHGRAQTIDKVFQSIAAGGLGHPAPGATAQQLADLAVFLRSIDSRTQIFP